MGSGLIVVGLTVVAGLIVAVVVAVVRFVLLRFVLLRFVLLRLVSPTLTGRRFHSAIHFIHLPFRKTVSFFPTFTCSTHSSSLRPFHPISP